MKLLMMMKEIGMGMRGSRNENLLSGVNGVMTHILVSGVVG
jgi:hypothetical protein